MSLVVIVRNRVVVADRAGSRWTLHGRGHLGDIVDDGGMIVGVVIVVIGDQMLVGRTGADDRHRGDRLDRERAVRMPRGFVDRLVLALVTVFTIFAVVGRLVAIAVRATLVVARVLVVVVLVDIGVGVGR